MDESISDLIMKYFRAHPNQDIKHGPVVDWVEEKYLKIYGKKPRDTWRQIRKLHQEGKLIKVAKGIYKYDPKFIRNAQLEDFPSDVKEAFDRETSNYENMDLKAKDIKTKFNILMNYEGRIATIYGII